MTEDVMSGIDQYTTKKLVPAFGDPELGIAVTRLVLTRSQSEVASHLSAFRKTCRIVKRQDERQRGQGPYAGDLLQQIPGIGALTSLAFILTLDDPARFPKSRQVGCYLGLRPRQNQSGDSNPQLGITKGGDELLRRLLVNAAHYILGHFGPDSDLRRWGLAIAARGGKRAKKRAVAAVARKLAVLLHHLWVTGDVYEPFHNTGKAA